MYIYICIYHIVYCVECVADINDYAFLFCPEGWDGMTPC